MHYLIHGVGTAGDVLPFIGIGSELRRRGHQVTIMANSFFEDVATKAGLQFHSLGPQDDYLSVIRDPRLWHASESFELLARRWILPHLQATYTFISRTYDRGSTAVIGSGAAFGARLAQEQLGVPLLSVVVSPMFLPSVHESLVLRGWSAPSWTPSACKAAVIRLLDHCLDRLLAPSINEFRCSLGLPRLDRHVRAWWFSPETILALYPDWFASRQPDWPSGVKVLEFPYFDGGPRLDTSSRAQAFLNHPEPYVVFARGSVASESAGFFRESIHACKGLKMRALLLGGEQPDGILPPNMEWHRYVPLGQALKSAAAVVHHGGIGTISLCVAAGLPQVAVPFGHDQFDNAARLERLGVAKTIARNRYTAAAVEHALRKVLGDSSFRRQAQSLAVRCDPVHSLERVCQVIESAQDQAAAACR